MPAHDPSKSGKWSFSMKKKSKNDKEKYDDFIVPKYPTPATAAYGFPYYPQMQTTFPAYYAPVPMAVMQPFGVQQPVFAMPQAYVPMPTYQTTAAPVQPAVAPPIQPAPTTQMPVPAPALASARTHAMQMPIPTPGPPISAAPPPTAPTQMPQPHPIYDPPPTHGPVMPPSPVLAEPVIPPPPNFNSEPPRPAPDSVRPRFTDFYRPVDMPDPPPRRPSFDEPVRPPTAGPFGRTPFIPPMQMPTPMPMPMSNNPLPPPPANVWDSSPYRQVLENLPNELPPLLDLHPCSDSFISMPEPVPRPSSRLGGFFGSTSRRDKGKNPLRGLFRSRSTSGHDVQNDLGSISGSQHGHGRAQTMTTFLVPAPTSTSTMDIPPVVPSTSMPVPDRGPPIRFDHTGNYAGFVNHSNHRVMYKNKMYPTALHLLEAMKFIHQPALQERIRTCKDVNDMYPLSASYQEHVRSDWGQVFLQTMEDVLYLKFKQHPSLRMLLLRTGLLDIVYADDNEYWGEGPLGEGANELGKALVRVRERLQQEGER
ncbi:hypothetical protein J3R82DRAFT_4643 [Butyriboletus roseoflavus]|nr:hypothetical protein J3R82DRAFT_4643 [Butyriboletus roseoflavus]